MPPQGDTSICGKYTVLIWLLLILNKGRRKYAALVLYITAVKPGNYGLAFTIQWENGFQQITRQRLVGS